MERMGRSGLEDQDQLQPPRHGSDSVSAPRCLWNEGRSLTDGMRYERGKPKGKFEYVRRCALIINLPLTCPAQHPVLPGQELFLSARPAPVVHPREPRRW